MGGDEGRTATIGDRTQPEIRHRRSKRVEKLTRFDPVRKRIMFFDSETNDITREGLLSKSDCTLISFNINTFTTQKIVDMNENASILLNESK